MTKKKTIIMLIVLAVVGSIINFYTTNMALSDLSNMFYGVHDAFCITTIPGVMVSFEFVLFTLYVMRRFLRPQYIKALNRQYSILTIVFSSIGLIAAVISAEVFYPGWFSIYPFPYYCIVSFLWHALMTVGSIINLSKNKKREDDKVHRPFKIRYTVYTVFNVLIIFFAYDRFGALLFAPLYVQLRTLYMTIPFYISLLLPMALLVQSALFMFGVYEKRSNFDVWYLSVVLFLNVVLFAAVTVIGSHNTQFISAISPALGIERLATKPIDTIVQFILVMIFGLYTLTNSIHYKRKGKKEIK